MPAPLALAVWLVPFSLLAAFAVWLHFAPWLLVPSLAGSAFLFRRLSWPGLRMLVFLPFLALYLFRVTSPETQTDALTYHLTLLKEGFPSRTGFYEVLPQAMEALFAVAGSITSARLIHLSLLVASLPLIILTGRKLDLDENISWAAALIYFVTPIVGVTATSALTDAALVFFVLATALLFLDDHPLYSGLTAGFCYAIKVSGLVVAAALLAGFLLQRRWRPAVMALAGAAVSILPWTTRAFLLTGNPIAPLGNRIFPNPFFHLSSENDLGQYLRTYGDVHWWQIPWELCVRGEVLQGLIGPLFLLSPVALLALHKRSGRWLWIAGALAALPWLFNIGTRFLMPALPFLALAILDSLPRRAAWPLAALHAVLSLPVILPLYTGPNALILRRQSDLPLDYYLCGLVNRHIPPGAAFLDLAGVPPGCLNRQQPVNYWQHALGDRFRLDLDFAARSAPGMLLEIRAQFPERALRAIRIRQTANNPHNLRLHEVALYRNGDRLTPTSLWILRATPNPWEAALALDGNLVSSWSSWEPMRDSMSLEVAFEQPKPITDVRLLLNPESADARLLFEGRLAPGAWQSLDPAPRRQPFPGLNLRRAAIQLLRRERISFLLVPLGNEGFGPIGHSMLDDPAGWDLRHLGDWEGFAVFRLPGL